MIHSADEGLSELIEIISLKRMDRAQSEIGYWVAPDFWRTGIANSAVSALLAANREGYRTIFAQAFQDDLRSARVFTNCGFVYLGDAEVLSLAHNAHVPTWTYLYKFD
ncbi:MAG: RimJ/RimL family protein N-acetyltransferase [Paracoccaceae bacterium]